MAMETTEVISRIKYIMGELRLRQNAFAARIGCDVTNLSKLLNGKLSITDSFINKIVVGLGVSKAWLVNGEGVPFGKHSHPDSVVVGNFDNAQDGLPVYDLDVTAGALTRDRLFADDRIIGRLSMPGVDCNCRIVRVSGDSMSPVIDNGDYIAVREVSDTSIIYWGQIYVVLLDDYRMVKYLRRHTDESLVVLRSANPAYDDIDLPKTAIRRLFFVTKIIKVQEAG